jgi:Tfp pilus assembly protein PilX
MRRMWRLSLGDERGAIFIASLVLVMIMTILGVSLFDLSMIEGRLATGDVVSSQVLYCAEAALGRTMNDSAGRMTQIGNLLAASSGGTLTFTETVTSPLGTCSNTIVFKEVAAVPATACVGGWCRYLTATSTGAGGTQRGVRIQLLGLGLWRNWNSASLNQNGLPYWDGNSSDFATVGNIGSWLSNTGAFTGGSGPGVTTYPFWGDSYTLGSETGGTPRPDIFFRGNGGTVTFKAEFTAYDGHHGPAPDKFGWFESTASGTVGTLHQLFNAQNYTANTQLGLIAGPAAVSVAFASIGSGTKYYGFYLTNSVGETMYTLSSKQAAGNPAQHFALFKQDANTYWLGVEDLNSSPDRDFQDMIFKFVVSGDAVVDPSAPGPQPWKDWQECPPCS